PSRRVRPGQSWERSRKPPRLPIDLPERVRPKRLDQGIFRSADSRRTEYALAEKRQHHQGVGLHACPIADLLRLGQVVFGLRGVAGIEMKRSKSVVAGE